MAILVKPTFTPCFVRLLVDGRTLRLRDYGIGCARSAAPIPGHEDVEEFRRCEVRFREASIHRCNVRTRVGIPLGLA